MTSITLTLPYPISANRYWRTGVVRGRAMTWVSKEAAAYKTEVQWLCKKAGIPRPLAGRVAIEIKLYPNRPQDFQRRMRKEGATWDDTVQCIDLDNANKVLLDALKGVAMGDDKFVRRLSSERMEPDAHGARVVITITSMAVAPQASLTLDPADMAAGVAVHRAQESL